MHCPCLNTLSCLSTCFLFDFTQRIQWIKNITRGSALSKNTQPGLSCPRESWRSAEPQRRWARRVGPRLSGVGDRRQSGAAAGQHTRQDRRHPPTILWISSNICWHSEWQTPRETRRWAGLFSHANKSAKLDLLNSLHTYLNVDYVF